MSLFLLAGCATVVGARQTIEVIELQNRDAASLVSVVANVIGPEGRVTADARTNSLIVACPEDLAANVRQVIATLDRAEPNVRVELLVFEAKTAWLERVGLTGKSRLGREEYVSLLPLLVQSEEATLAQRQQVTTKSHVPARVVVAAGPVSAYPDGYVPPAHETWLEVLPGVLAHGLIEVELGTGSPSSAARHARGQLFTTVVVEDGGALVLGGLSQSEGSRHTVQSPLFPLGLESRREDGFQRVLLLHVTTDEGAAE